MFRSDPHPIFCNTEREFHKIKIILLIAYSPAFKHHFTIPECGVKMIAYRRRRTKTVAGGSRLVASRLEVMLPPAGSEARWREEVMPGRSSGEVMLALTCQEAKTKEKEHAN
jgi:predicted RNA methylase